MRISVEYQSVFSRKSTNFLKHFLKNGENFLKNSETDSFLRKSKKIEKEHDEILEKQTIKNVWLELKKKYNIKSMSRKELHELNLKMLLKGVIDVEESFKISLADVNIKECEEGYEVKEVQEANWIERIKLRGTKELEIGNKKEYELYLNLAEKLEQYLT
ncbi:MAG: hypothetical protein N4A54_13395 [Peptostreptococcaceae bacterium]|jgi:vacuolar-type H+-ATPase subunit B/Vma2|nr:hypothetical protein [Peptostreptococcaceae bacterium]